MVEVKLRLATLDTSLNPPSYPVHPDAYVEFAHLQLRKALELIALASLVSNRAAYTATYQNFEKARDARLIFRDLERINGKFYPVPAVEVRSSQPGVQWHLDIFKEEYLTKSKFLKLYERCGSVLHTQNPYGAKRNLAAYISDISTQRRLIASLLNVHTIELAGVDDRYLVHMNDSDGNVHQYTLTRQ